MAREDLTPEGGIEFVAQEFAFGQRIGVRTDTTATKVIQSTIDALAKVPGDLPSILATLFGGSASSQPFGYDPSADWLIGISLNYNVVGFDVLLVDGQFYGLLINIGEEGPPPPSSEQPFAGLGLEILYRKVNDHLGEFSADLTLPSKYRTITLGEPPEDTTITLPAVGLAIWTNGDFMVNIGWPLGERSFNITFPPDPIPWAGGGGLYFAKLRSEDAPTLGSNFATIIEFGIALRVGAATSSKNASIVEYEASLYLFGSFQGFLAWETHHPISGGVDYYWFCATVGIQGHLEGTVNFKIIKVSLSLTITASATLALETKHSTTAEVEFKASVRASVKILFFRVSFSFTLDLHTQIQFGSGPPSLITGPSPPKLNGTARVAPPSRQLLVPPVAAIPTVPIALKAHLVLQPTIRQNPAGGAWQPVGVATLMLERPAVSFSEPGNGTATRSLGLGTDGFSQLAASLAAHLFATYSGYTDPTQPLTTAEVQAVLAALEAGRFDLQAIYTWMGASQISFTIAAAQDGGGNADLEAALLPIIPGLQLTYNGATTVFGDAEPPPGYLTELADYFAKLSFVGDGHIIGAATRAVPATPPPPSPSWFPGLLFADAYNLLAKQLTRDIEGLATPGTLAAALAQLDVGNLAGTLSRFLAHGQRLPDPAASGPVESLPTLGLYELTGQQLVLAQDAHGNPILSAQLAVGSPRVSVTIEGDGVAALPFALTEAPEQGPLRAPRPLERIQQVPVAYFLRHGFDWAQQTTTDTTPWLLFDFPGQLQSALRLSSSPLNLALAATDGSTSSPVEGTEALLIRFALSAVPPVGPTDKLAGKVFKVAGPDEATRDLIELLFASGELAGAHLDLLLPAGEGAYKTSAADAEATLLRTDLSTAGGPALSALFADALQARAGATSIPALGPTSAQLSSPTDFLRLLWECSVVHSAGFFLYVPDLDTSSKALSYEVAVLVRASAAKPLTTLPVDSHHTTIVVAAGIVKTGERLRASLYQSDGKTPVTEPKPGYPAGTLAFGASWSATDTPPMPAAALAANSAAYAAALYQLLELRLAGDAVIEASAWSMPLGPDGDEAAWSYRRAVPVQRFVAGASATPNRYAAIGHPTKLELRLLDVFGNATALPPLTLTAFYNDPLIALDEWPGAVAAYAFQAAGEGAATLLVEVAFNPEQVVHRESALIYYQTVYDQLTDPRTAMSFMTALADGPVAMAAAQHTTGQHTAAQGAAAQAALAAFVAQIIAFLDPKTPGPAPAAVVLTGTLQSAYVAQIGEDMFPVWVTIVLRRDAPQESPTYPYPPGFLSAETQVSLRLDPVSSTPEAALRNWAIGFEAAFAGFDGDGAILKVLAGSPPSKVASTASPLGASSAAEVTSVPGDVWALRWSPQVGVAVQFPNSQQQASAAPVYFTAMPLSTQLLGGVVDIYGYDATGKRQPQPTPTTFSGVDLDGWASAFLSAFDALLAPDLAAAIARLNSTEYAALMNAKEDLAFAIAAGVSWVFEDQMPPTGGGGAGAGDLEAAQLSLRESLLSSLGADFATSAIVQVPASVAVNGPFAAGAGSSRPAQAGTGSSPPPDLTGEGSSRPPDLFGSPTPIPPPEEEASAQGQSTLAQYTVSSAALPIASGAGELTFLVGAANPTTQADLCMGFNYDIAFIDHRFQMSAEQYGYVPSSWLRFVVPDVDPGAPATPALDVPMGQLDIPIPLRAYPSPPRLVRQAASAAHIQPTTLSETVEFAYSLTVASPSAAQDDLHLAVLVNGATVERPTSAQSTSPLFAPLARFQDFQQRYLASATQAVQSGDVTAAQWCADIVALTQEVAAAWLGPDKAQEHAQEGEPQLPPLPWSWDLRLQVPDETHPNVMLLDWTGVGAAPAAAWPTIEGTAGVPLSATRMSYTLPSTANLVEPTLLWQGLSAITAQSITTAAWIVRNETLAGGQQERATNPGLLYSTATVTFPDPVVPLLQVPTPLTLAATTSLAGAVGELVSGAMQPTTPAAQVGWGLEAGYEFALLSGGLGEMRTRLPAFLARTQLTTAPDPPSGVDSIASLTAALVKELTVWHDSLKPSGERAALVFSLTIFAAGGDQPLVRLIEVRAPISGSGWWPA
jgi:hypothetical protein